MQSKQENSLIDSRIIKFQVIARYNIERLCAGLDMIKNLSNFREVLKEAYFPKLLRGSNNRTYPPRAQNTLLVDVNRPVDGVGVEISDIERWRDRILEAIDAGFIFGVTLKLSHILLL